jgi:hypothetical protein
MERQYFDNTLLAQFYVTKMPISVYVDGDLLRIVDADDITDAYIGNGMTISGKMMPFDYRDIQFITVGKNQLTIDDVNKAYAAKNKPAENDKPEPEDDAEDEEETKAKKESIDTKTNMKRLTEKLGIAQVSEPYTIQTGDMIHNVNKSCMHYGSKGIANGTFDEDGVTMIRYTVTNKGDTFKPGDTLTKSIDQLAPMDLDDTDFDMPIYDIDDELDIDFEWDDSDEFEDDDFDSDEFEDEDFDDEDFEDDEDDDDEF